MTKAEKSAIAYTEHMFHCLVEEKRNTGPAFNKNTFDIANFVDANIWSAYKTGKVPEKSRKKARKAAQKLWDNLIGKTS